MFNRKTYSKLNNDLVFADHIEIDICVSPLNEVAQTTIAHL